MFTDETTTNKLLTLFILDKLVVPIGEDLLIRICTYENDWMNYMLCRDALDELITSGFIEATGMVGTKERLLSLTEDGRTCLAHFYKQIPLSIRENVAAVIDEKLLSYRVSQECRADYYRNDNGSFTTDLKILDSSAKPIMDLKMIVPNRAIAASIFNSWCEKGPEVYKALHDILIGD